jgi:hypothetical protein
VKRRILRLGLLLVSAVTLLPGCETLEHRRLRHEDDAKSEEEVEKAGFFSKGSRISGAMSSEGRSIERDLGIP